MTAGAPIIQSSTVTPGHALSWTTDGVAQDAGPATEGALSELGITKNGGIALGINSGVTTGPYVEYGVGVASNGTIIVYANSFGGAPSASLYYNINGVLYPFNPSGGGNITGPGSSVSGDLVSFSGTGGNLVQDSGIPQANVVQGPTAAVSGDVVVFNGATGKLIEDTGVLAANLVTATGGVTISSAMKPVVSAASLAAGQQAFGVDPATFVLMYYNATASAWVVLTEVGVVLNTSGTNTDGLQEAINYAVEFGHNLWIMGGGVVPGSWPPPFNPVTHPGSDNTVINYGVQIVVPAIQKGKWRFDGVTFNYTGSASTVTWTWDSTELFELDSSGCQWVANTTNIIMSWAPTNQWPEDTFGPAVGSVIFKMGAIVQLGTGPCARLDGTNGAIQNATFFFTELNAGAEGLQLVGATHGVVNNKITSVLAHEQTAYAVQVGISSADATTVTGNILELICTSPGVGCVGIDVWGTNNRITGSVSNGSNNFLVGLKLESTAANNNIDMAILQGTTLILDVAGVTANNWVNPRGVNVFTSTHSVVFNPIGFIDQTMNNATSSTGGSATPFPVPFPTQVDSCVASPNNGVAYEEVFANAGTVTITVNSGTPTFFVFARGH